MAAYVAWRAGTTTLFVPIAPRNCLKIPEQLTGQRFSGIIFLQVHEDWRRKEDCFLAADLEDVGDLRL